MAATVWVMLNPQIAEVGLSARVAGHEGGAGLPVAGMVPLRAVPLDSEWRAARGRPALALGTTSADQRRGFPPVKGAALSIALVTPSRRPGSDGGMDIVG